MKIPKDQGNGGSKTTIFNWVVVIKNIAIILLL